MSEPTDVDKLIAEVVEAAAYRSEMQARQVPTHAHAGTGLLADSAGLLAAEVQRLRDAAQVVLAMVEAIGRRAFTTDGWAAVLELRRALEGGE